MDRLNKVSSALICGTISQKPQYSHRVWDKKFYTFPLNIQRLSGAVDTINVICTGDMLSEPMPEGSTALKVVGEVRSHNNKSGVGNRLQVFVFAETLEFCCEEHQNQVCLTGTLCKEPKLRVTPLGREICDLLLAVNRPQGRSDYLPCICWGKNARIASDLTVGSRIRIEGRIQSRSYIKAQEDGQVTKTAYEVSAMKVEVIDQP